MKLRFLGKLQEKKCTVSAPDPQLPDSQIRSLFMMKKSIESGSKARRFGAIHRDWKNKQSGKKDSNRMKMTKVENGLP